MVARQRAVHWRREQRCAGKWLSLATPTSYTLPFSSHRFLSLRARACVQANAPQSLGAMQRCAENLQSCRRTTGGCSILRRRQSGVLDRQNVQGRCAGEGRHRRPMHRWTIVVGCVLMPRRLEMARNGWQCSDIGSWRVRVEGVGGVQIEKRSRTMWHGVMCSERRAQDGLRLVAALQARCICSGETCLFGSASDVVDY
jgi:hypothetical protein